MRAHRLATGDEVAEVAARGKLSKSTWSAIENGHAGNYSDRTLSAIDRALKWEHGTSKGILGGGPVPPLPEVAGLPSTLEDRLERIEAVQVAARAELAEVRALVNRLERLLSPQVGR